MSKSLIPDAIKDYRKMYDIIKYWDEDSHLLQKIDGKVINKKENYIYGPGWAVDAASYYGFDNKDVFGNEWNVYKNVKRTYREFLQALEDAIGINEEQ